MKHVGLNVAADPFFSASNIGVKGGLVIVSADDPAMHSSQDEQDNRQYARFAKMPMIEPAEAGEAVEYLRAAYELSERFDTPVLFRTTTRTSHSQGIVVLGERPAELPAITTLDRDPAKNLMMPHNARPRHAFVEQRLAGPGRVGRDHRAQPRRDGRSPRRHRHLGRLVRLRPRGVSRRRASSSWGSPTRCRGG